MSSQVISFEGSDETIHVLDEIAESLGVDRSSVLREAVSLLVSHYSELNADIGEARRQIDAGQFTRHEDVVREFRSRTEDSRAA